MIPSHCHLVTTLWFVYISFTTSVMNNKKKRPPACYIASLARMGNYYPICSGLTSCTMTGTLASYSSLFTPVFAPSIVVTQCKHNEHSGVTAKHAPALCFRTTSSRWHTASVSTFEDMEHFDLILLVFFQQVAIRKHAGCSHSTSKEHGKSELRLLPHPKLKTHPYNVCVAPYWQHFGQSD